MRVVVTIQHPAHVHFFRHVYGELTAAGHDVHVFAREKDVAVSLLDAFDIPYTLLAGSAGSLPALARVQATYEYRLLRHVRRLDPDVLTAISGVAVSHVGFLTRTPSVVFTDDEATNRVVVPFADVVCTPRNYPSDYGRKHHRYDGYHELAYLHPDRFEPDPSVLARRGVDPDADFAVVRFSDMAAHHDVGESGFSRAGKRELLDTLAAAGDVYVSAAAEGGEFYAEHALPVAPEEIHHLLYYADLFVTDSNTMATEAGLLGTPTVRSNSFAGDDDMHNFLELADRGLVCATPAEDEALAAVRDLLADPDAGERWRANRDRLLARTVDVTDVAVEVLTAAASGERADREPAEVRTRA